MPSIAIELNDAEIRIAGPEGMRGVEPGCALLDGETLTIGSEALRSARLQPAQTHDRFWSNLSHEPLPHAHPQASSIADLAFAQLSSLWARFGNAGTDVVFVVPGWFERDQLGLLLGIAQACGIRVRGLVDAAVASSRRPHDGQALAYVDAGLHAAAVTRLDQSLGIAAESTECDRGFGLGALYDDWLACIARTFLGQTRFDPLHDAEAEQALFDRLPLCLEALVARDSARIEIEIRGAFHVADVKRADLVEAAAPHYAQLLGLVERGRPPSGPLVLQVSDRLTRLPGLAYAITRAPQVEVVELASDAACAGALERIDEFGDSQGLVLVKRLSWGPGVGSPGTMPAPSVPSHVVVNGIAHPLSAAPFVVGNCTLRLVDDGAVLEGDAGAAWPDGEPLPRSARLRAGDRVRLVDSGIELEVVALARSSEEGDGP